MVYAAEFQGLGDLPGGEFHSSPSDISADGRVIVGNSKSRAPNISDGREAFIWTPEEGMVGLGFLPSNGPDVSSQAEAISSDGAAIVGLSMQFEGETPYSATFRWTRSEGLESIGAPVGGIQVSGNGISGNGQVIAGTAGLPGVAGYPDVFRWTEQSGFQILAMPATLDESFTGKGISADGSTIVGEHVRRLEDESIVRSSFVWHEASGLKTINSPPESSYYWTQATAISDDGSLVTGGVQRLDGPPDAFVWTEQVGLTPLKYDHNDGNAVHAYDVSGDGKVVVGQMFPMDDPSAVVPMIWDAFRGPRDLQELLATQFGLADELAGWRLEHAFTVAQDGTVIAGAGINPQGNYEAWRAVLDPEPAPVLLPGDANLDGVVDVDDLRRVQANMGIGSFWYQGNFDGVDRVSEADLAIVRANMIPEPSTMVLAAVGMLWICACLRPLPRRERL